MAGLALGLVDRLRRTAAFANPMFFERERARLSTHKTPRVIACHELSGGRLLLPRGCLTACATSSATPASHWSSRTSASRVRRSSARSPGALSADQERAVDALVANMTTGVLVAPPGSGKTVMAVGLIARRACRTLVLVHRRPLLEQWVKRLARFLGLDPSQIGVTGTT